MKRAGSTLLVAFLTLPTCVAPATDRATRDLDVGRAERAEARVIVDEGLAAVRKLEAGELRLWAQAPSLRFAMTLSAGAGGPWSIVVENSLSDAELFARDPSGAVLPVTLVTAPVPTERHFTVELPAGTPIELTLRPPDEGLSDPWRFAIFADVQTAIDDVKDVYSKINEDSSLRFALIGGDLTETGTREELERFQREMKALNIPAYSTLGNHELGLVGGDLYHEYFGRGNFRFTFRGAQITMLDSASATIDPLVYDWLDGWLSEGRSLAHVVVMHIPPLDPIGTRNGSFASRAEADKLLAKLADGGVDLTVYGHIHSYYAFANAGIPAYITGGGGALPEKFDGIGRHFLTVDVHPPGAIGEVSLVRVDVD